MYYQQAGNKQCEYILLTSCWNSIAAFLRVRGHIKHWEKCRVTLRFFAKGVKCGFEEKY